MRNVSKQSGFTLMEMMMVVMIMGIAAAIMVPMMSSNTFFQLQGAVRDLDSIIQFTQNMAITDKQIYKIVFDDETDEFAVYDQNDELVDDPGKNAPTGTTEPEKYKLKRVYTQDQQYGLVRISAVSFDGESILWFNGIGMPYSGETGTTPLSSGEVTLTAGDHSMKLIVEPVSGKVKIE